MTEPDPLEFLRDIDALVQICPKPEHATPRSQGYVGFAWSPESGLSEVQVGVWDSGSEEARRSVLAWAYNSLRRVQEHGPSVDQWGHYPSGRYGLYASPLEGLGTELVADLESAFEDDRG